MGDYWNYRIQRATLNPDGSVNTVLWNDLSTRALHEQDELPLRRGAKNRLVVVHDGLVFMVEEVDLRSHGSHSLAQIKEPRQFGRGAKVAAVFPEERAHRPLA